MMKILILKTVLAVFVLGAILPLPETSCAETRRDVASKSEEDEFAIQIKTLTADYYQFRDTIGRYKIGLTLTKGRIPNLIVDDPRLSKFNVSSEEYAFEICFLTKCRSKSVLVLRDDEYSKSVLCDDECDEYEYSVFSGVLKQEEDCYVSIISDGGKVEFKLLDNDTAICNGINHDGKEFKCKLYCVRKI